MIPDKKRGTGILLMGTHPFASNRGCAAMCMSMIGLLRSYFTDAQLSICNYNYEQPRIDRGASEFLARYGMDPRITVQGHSRISRARKLAEFLSLLNAVHLLVLWRTLSALGIQAPSLLTKNKALRRFLPIDIVLDLKWGDQFTDIYGIYTTFVWFYESLIPLLLRKPYVLLPQSIGPFNSPVTRRLAKYILSGARVIMVRENKTRDYLIRLGIEEAKLMLTPDTAFFLPSSRDRGRSATGGRAAAVSVKNRLSVGITLRNTACPSESDATHEKFMRAMADLTKHMAEKYRPLFILIPHDGIAWSADVYRDFIRRTEDTGDCLYLNQREYSTEELRTVIGSCHITVSAYLHANIAAFAMRVPTIGFAYSQKALGIFELMGLQDYVMRLDALDGEKLIATADRLWNNRDGVQAHLASRMEAIAGLEPMIPKVIDNILKNAREKNY